MAFNSSKAKSRYFEYLESKGKLPKAIEQPMEYSHEYDEMEEEMPHFYKGGRVDEYHPGLEDNLDYEMGHATSYVSSGEPHTEDNFQDEKPMEYMNRGGMAKKMSRGGRMPAPGFVKALRKASYR